jgi:hypothetical protein
LATENRQLRAALEQSSYDEILNPKTSWTELGADQRPFKTGTTLMLNTDSSDSGLMAL